MQLLFSAPNSPNSPDSLHSRYRAYVLSALALCTLTYIDSVAAQTTAPAEATRAPVKPPSDVKKTEALERVEVIGKAPSETDQRRQSTAAKIVIGRDEIEKYGDNTTGELLKRLPGITMPGAPGRGGAPRMRGMGGGYTQIMIDGQRVAPGFSLDDLAPEQIERIEILRAPTAETGARAIAGTINIITRGGYVRKVNDLRVGVGIENNRTQPGFTWSRNDTAGDLTYNFSISGMRSERDNDSLATVLGENLTLGTNYVQRTTTQSSGAREGLHTNGRLQWRSENGDTLVLTPMLILSNGSSSSQSQLTRTDGLAAYSTSQTDSQNKIAMLRLNGQWTHQLDAGGNFNWGFGWGTTQWNTHSLQNNIGGQAGLGTSLGSDTQQRDSSLTSNAKWSLTLSETQNLVTGLELEANQRKESSTASGVATDVADLNGNLDASSTRAAVFVQDEWTLSSQWSAHAGVRWEGIRTEGSVTAGDDVSNTSSVLTPLLHAVWKFSPQSRDQLRWSLTRSYRSPDLSNLIARPSINSQYLSRGSNTALYPDRAGNPDLKPELASGLDMAIEHYMEGGGILSANVFYRTISNLIRNQTALETVSWADQQRWVSRPQNIGDASIYGLELEAKFRLSELVTDAPKVDIRANASLFHSDVSGITGPNNRVAEQPDGTLNLGVDYRLPSLPLTIGGNINWTPSYTTQLSNDQSSTQGDKLALEAYGLWVFSSAYQLRISASNINPRDYTTSGVLLSTNSLGQNLRESTTTTTPTSLNLQLRLEMKL